MTFEASNDPISPDFLLPRLLMLMLKNTRGNRMLIGKLDITHDG